jgi:hypothetical protein
MIDDLPVPRPPIMDVSQGLKLLISGVRLPAL